MKRLHLPMMAVLLVISVGSCGPATYSVSSAPKSKPYTREHETPELARRAIETAQVSCFGDDCNDSVAMLVSIEGASTGQCTGFLISPTLLVTNSHCITPSIKQKPEACANLAAVFPKTSRFETERVKCAKVEFSSQIIENSLVHMLDYAVVRLEREVNRPAIQISRKGLGDADESFTVYKVNPNPGTVSGWMQKITCQPALRSKLMPSYLKPTSPIAVLGDCEVRPGNSGSPVLDSEGHVRAIMHATVPAELSHKLSKEIGTPLAAIGLASNWACFTAPNLEEVEGKIANICAEKSDIMYDESATELPAAGSPEQGAMNIKVSAYKVEAAEWFKSSPANRFEWQEIIEVKGLTQSHQFAPKCLKRDLGWLDGYTWLNVGFFKAYPKQAEIRLDIPTLTKKTQYDRYLRPDIYFLQETKRLDLAFSPEDWAQDSGNSEKLAATISGGAGQDRGWLSDMFKSKTMTIPLCPRANTATSPQPTAK